MSVAETAMKMVECDGSMPREPFFEDRTTVALGAYWIASGCRSNLASVAPGNFASIANEE